MIRLPTCCQAILIALAIVCAVNARVILKQQKTKNEPKTPQVVAETSAAVTPFRRALPPTTDADGCPASEMRIKSKSMLIEILQRSMKTKSEELVSFEEKGCKGGKCFKNLFTKLTCKCQIRGAVNEGREIHFFLFIYSYLPF